MQVFTTELQTKRLVLRALCKQDATAAFDTWTNDVAVAHYMPWNLHTSIRDTEEWLSIEISKINSSETFNWGIVEKLSGKLIGTIGINIENNACELGYCLSKRHWNKGYMTEAIQAVLVYAETSLNIESIYARVANENTQSARVLQKLGFQYVGECTYSSYDEKRIFQSKKYHIQFIQNI